jgi:purine catabolism regulator
MVTVRELLSAIPDTEIYAGHGGLDNKIQTISFIDAPSSVDFLHGGEIILTTAFLYKENAEMQYSFVNKLIDMHVVALGIKVGRYIKHVPEPILALADRAGFPIFGISFDTVWSEIFSAFYNLALDKRSESSILSTEMLAFEKLFRSSTWSIELIRSNFLKCVVVPAAIVSENYDMLSRNDIDDCGVIEAYREKRAYYHKNSVSPALFVSHAKGMRKLFDLTIYEKERLILCSTGGDIIDKELDWIKTLYLSIRNKNRFLQDTPILWRNFIRECVIGGADENIKAYMQALSINEGFVGVIIIFGGKRPREGADELGRALRAAGRGYAYHDVESADGGIIELVFSPQDSEPFEFLSELRALLENVAALITDCFIWMGNPAAKPQALRESHRSALKARKLAEVLLPGENLVAYRDLGFIDCLWEGGYDFEEIACLVEKITSFDACKTLEIYLESVNLKRAAESSFIHDNTLRYRIRKIEQTLGLSLSKPVNRLNLLIKLKLWRLGGGETR